MAAQLDIPHYVFNFTDEFDAAVVEPYVAAYANGSTPNPCVECNRAIKFGRLLERADALGFDAVATGHHARGRGLGRRHAAPPTRRRPRQGPVVRDLHARPARADAHDAPGRRPHEGRGACSTRRGSGSALPPRRRAWTSASSPRRAGAVPRGASGFASRSGRRHRRRRRRSSPGCRGASPSGSGAASAWRSASDATSSTSTPWRRRSPSGLAATSRATRCSCARLRSSIARSRAVRACRCRRVRTASPSTRPSTATRSCSRHHSRGSPPARWSRSTTASTASAVASR